jgi:FlaG/FlaF family flagellin (archaellin)
MAARLAKRSLKEVGLIAAEVVAMAAMVATLIASLTTMVQQPEQVAMLQCRQDDARAEDDLLKYQTPSGAKRH